MKEDDFKEKAPQTENPADNMTDKETNEQIDRENPDWEPSETDNVSDELAEMKDSYLRLMAEYDNYRKRTLKEKAELIKNGGERVLTGLLPVIDDFERALDNANNATDIKSVVEGIELIYNKFISFLYQNGVKPIDACGYPFDDEIHDAVATVPAQEENRKGIIID
ncbi:MAG: nucleotide exchange factor GrpE, partial [Dysgonamonadaceae bacterium]|nr:nucleotide exchange factor GrpE [Dysgonamonadaceae bacterium]